MLRKILTLLVFILAISPMYSQCVSGSGTYMLDVTITSDNDGVCKPDAFTLSSAVSYVDLTGTGTGSGTGTLSYVWGTPNNGDITGGAAGFFTVNPTAADDAGTYTVTVSDSFGCSATAEIDVAVNCEPTINVPVVNGYACEGDEVEFTIDATPGAGAVLSYQWFIIDNGANIAMGTDDSQTVTANATGLGVYVVVTSEYPTGPACSVTSNVANLVVGQGETFACNGSVNVSLDENCSLGALDASIFLEGETTAAYYGYEVLGILDQPVNLDNPNGPNHISDYVGQCLTYRVFDACTGNSCWGEICIEDKAAPTLDCDCETPFLPDGTPNPDCTFKCYEIWDLEILEEPGRNNEILPDADDMVPDDNCVDFGDPIYNITYSDGPGCEDVIVSRELLWTYTDNNGDVQYLSCTQNFLFEGLDITSIGATVNGAWDGYPDIFTANSGDRPMQDIYTPEQIVYLECGAGTDPADIAAAYDIDTPGRPTGIDKDDHAQTPNIVEHNEGYPYAYPYVVVQGWAGRFHAKPIDNNICNIYTVYTDLTYDTCADDCYGNSKIARSWTILDWCTATTVEFVQTIKRVDQDGPAISGPDHIVSVDPWSCAANFEIPAPEHLLDNCDKNPTWSVVGPTGVQIVNGIALDLPKGVTTLTYVAEDCCGNQSQSSFDVLVEDRTAPTAIALQNLVVQLVNEQDEDGIAKLYAVDVDNESHDGCTDIHFELRREGGEDCHAGNSTFNNDGHEGDHADDTDAGEYVKFCCADLTEIDENGTSYGIHNVILRVWDDGDMNGVFGSAGDNYNETWTTVRVEDKQQPVVVCPPHIELSCHEDYLNYELTGVPYAFKTCEAVDCDMEPSDSFRKKSANQPPFVGEEIPAYNPSCRRGAIQRTWTCEGKTCTQWIIMRDTEDGDLEITWPEDQTVDCLAADPGQPDIVERLCELTGTSLESDTFKFEDGACYKVLNYWTVINWCDYDADDTDLNDAIDDEDDGVIPGYYTHTQVIKFIDTEKPVLSLADTCFAVNADCVGDNLAIWAAASDNGMCASAWLKWEVEVDMYSDWEVDYTYSSFLAPDDPFYVAPTGGIPAMPIAYDETVIVNNTFQSDATTGGEELPIEEIFGLDANAFAQAAIIRDKVEYIGYLNGLYDIDLDPECISFALVAEADDPTYGPFFRILEEGTVDRYYFNFPEGHNISGAVASNGSTRLVVLSSTEIVVEIGEGFDFSPGAAFKFDLQSVGESVHIPLPDGLPNGCASNHRVRWTVLDGCGNETSGTSFFTIEDKKKPTPYMLNLSTALMQDGSVELWAKDFDAGSFDNCSPQDYLLYTFSPNVPYQLIDPEEEDPWYDADGVASENDYNNGDAEAWNGALGSSAMVFNEDDLVEQEEKGGTLPIPIYVWDLCGNVDLAVVNLKLVDNNGGADIAGRIATEAGKGVAGVTVSAISEQVGYPASTVSVEDGEYMFQYNPMNNDYTLSGEKNDDWLNGVSTLDLVLIQRHILDISTLDSPYKLIAADASNDERISAIDLIQLRKLILGIYAELPNNDSWRFTDSDASMNASSPWPFSEFIDVIGLEESMLTEDFIAMKIGDVNGSVEVNLQSDQVEARNAKQLGFGINTVDLDQGEYALEFSSDNFNEIAGFQFTLEGTITEITGVDSGLLTIDAGNVALANNALVISWNDAKAISLANDVLFTVSVKMDANSSLNISDKVITSEAYQGPTLEVIGVNTIGSDAVAMNSLSQNEPNPWKASTTIAFNLENGGETTFKVYSATGELVYRNTANYTAGENVFTLSSENISGASGVLYYTIESGEYTATRKMIILK